MRWITGNSEWSWRFALWPVSRNGRDGISEWVWLEWYRVNAIGKVLWTGEERGGDHEN